MKKEPQNKKASPKEASDRDELDVSKANLIWDEYKYRHDLIWRHMIRTTLAVIGSVTLPLTFDESWVGNESYSTIITLVLVGVLLYLGLTIWIIIPELKRFKAIKTLHQSYQQEKHEIPQGDSHFNIRVCFLLGLLVLVALFNFTYWIYEMSP